MLAVVNCLRRISAAPLVYNGGKDDVIGPIDREEGGGGNDDVDA